MNKTYIVDGKCIIHDPGTKMIPVIKLLNPNYQMMSIKPEIGFRPKFQALRNRFIYLQESPLENEIDDLFNAINSKESRQDKGDKYSALDILYEISLKALGKCNLCGWNCGINRFQEEGKCGLRNTVHGSECFTHIAEEDCISPACVTNLGGCSLKCRYCIDYELLNPTTLPPIDPRVFWQEAGELFSENGRHFINSIEFTNPTENIHGVTSLLISAPADFNCPVVLNCHLYGSEFFYKIADQIADVWLVDLRYGNDKCAYKLSGVKKYMEYAEIGLNAICKKNNRVIVRLLVLPGNHRKCCHEPIMELLEKHRDHLWVSMLDQYVPEFEATKDRILSKRPTKEELEAVEKMIHDRELRNISDAEKKFWTN